MTEECHGIIRAIEKMETSLNDGKDNKHADERGDLRVSYPLTRCLQDLKQKHHTICKLHMERFEQVKSKLLPSSSVVRIKGLMDEQHWSRRSNHIRHISSQTLSKSYSPRPPPLPPYLWISISRPHTSLH